MINDISVDEKLHSEYSASSAHRWLNCPGSIAGLRNAKAQGMAILDESNLAAERGTFAHEIADRCLSDQIDPNSFLNKTHNSDFGPIVADQEMIDGVTAYIKYVKNFLSASSQFFCEDSVRYDNVVEGGFGTLDAAIYDPTNETCHIFDFKTGRAPVHAAKNEQMLLYAIGMRNLLQSFGEVSTFVLHIVQPRIDNFQFWTIDSEYLDKAYKAFKSSADETLKDDAPRIPGEKQCKWCPLRGNCSALSYYVDSVLEDTNFKNVDEDVVIKLNNNKKKEILDNSELIKSFVKSVRACATAEASFGEKFEGYKLVKKRKNRKWSEGAMEELPRLLGEDAYEKSLIGIGAAEKLIDKSEIAKLVDVVEGKPMLVPESDSRKELILK